LALVSDFLRELTFGSDNLREFSLGIFFGFSFTEKNLVSNEQINRIPCFTGIRETSQPGLNWDWEFKLATRPHLSVRRCRPPRTVSIARM
jgi:hypothetical protein